MIRRNNLKSSSTERFTYDELNRLTSVTDEYGTSDFIYDQLGRMTSKTSPNGILFTEADYSGTKPHAIKSVQSPKGVFPQERMDIAFNSYDKATSISAGTDLVSFDYGIECCLGKMSCGLLHREDYRQTSADMESSYLQKYLT